MNKLYQLKFGEIKGFISRQKASYWLILIYIIFEYLSPQMMYPAIDIIPWGKFILITTAILIALDGTGFTVKNSSNVLINTFFIVVLLSSCFALIPEISFFRLKEFIVLILVYYLIVNVVNTEERIFVFILLLLLVSLKLSQSVFIGWIGRGFEYERYGAAAGIGWLKNSGELAIQMCICFAISVFFLLSLWKHVGQIKKAFLLFMTVSFAGSVFACGSRGSYLGLASIFLFMWLGGRKKALGIILLIILALLTPKFLSERDSNRGLSLNSETDLTAQNRIERWKKGLAMVNDNPLFGVGFENYNEADRQIFGGKGSECHNIFIECMSELGYVGLIVFLLLIVSTILNNIKTMKMVRQDEDKFIYNLAKSLNLALIAYLVAGFFVTVLYYPYFWINLAMTVSLNNIARKKYTNYVS